HEGVIPPLAHYARPNPRIDFAASPFYINTELRPWQAGSTPRRAGISSFGVGGTNAHLVLEQAPTLRSASGARARQVFLLSARSEQALGAQAERLANHLEQSPD